MKERTLKEYFVRVPPNTLFLDDSLRSVIFTVARCLYEWIGVSQTSRRRSVRDWWMPSAINGMKEVPVSINTGDRRHDVEREGKGNSIT